MLQNHTYSYEGRTYKRASRTSAFWQLLTNPDRHFFLVGDNVHEHHFHTNWHLATFSKTIKEFKEYHPYSTNEEILKYLYNNFAFYLSRELGRYPIFYVEVMKG